MSDSPSSADPPPPAADPLIGALVGEKYRVEALLGRGGMGAVYRGVNTAIGKRVALKFLDRDGQSGDGLARFLREAQAASAVDSAHIVQVFDSGEHAGRPYLVMELLSGEDLRARLRRQGRVPVAELVDLWAQVLRALARAHDAGIVHRDLKPDNVFLCEREGEPPLVKIVDFGISKMARREAAADTITREGTVLGTVFYMAPEQAQGAPDVDGRADLYGLGAILFEALTGRPPHTGRTYEAVLVEACTHDAPDVRTLAPEVPAPLAAEIAALLARDRRDRPADARAALGALLAAAPDWAGPRSGSGSGAAVSVTARTRAGADETTGRFGPAPARWARRPAVALGLAAVTVVALGVWLGRGADAVPGGAAPAGVPGGAAAGAGSADSAAASATAAPDGAAASAVAATATTDSAAASAVGATAAPGSAAASAVGATASAASASASARPRTAPRRTDTRPGGLELVTDPDG